MVWRGRSVQLFAGKLQPTMAGMLARVRTTETLYHKATLKPAVLVSTCLAQSDARAKRCSHI